MEAKQVDANKTQKEIAKKIDENPGIGNTDLSEEVDIKPSSVNYNVNKLKEKGIIVDKEFKGNQNRYELSDTVDVDVNLKLERLLNWKVGIHFIEIFLFIALYFYFPLTQTFHIFLGFSAGFIPTFILTANYVLDEVDLTEIQLKIYEETESSE